MGKHITDFERALIRELALSGLFSAHWIAKMLGRNKGTILKFVKDIRHSPNIRFPNRTQLILKMHAEGDRNIVISRRLSISPTAVTLALKRRGMKRNPMRRLMLKHQKERAQWTMTR
jgi:DNA-binding NarL/FixJ family response regulator